MVLVSENIALIVFILIIVISVFAAWWLGSYSDYDKGKIHIFIALLGGLGVFVTFLFYYNVVSLQNKQQELAAIQELSRINDSMLNSVLQEMKDASILIPNFVTSITPLQSLSCCGSDLCNVATDPINTQTCTEKMILSYKIFSLWTDVIQTKDITHIDSLSMVSNFLQRTNSHQLFEQWQVARIDFNSDTQEFGDLLFEYGLPIKVQTPETYIATAEKMITDPRYIAIFK